MKEQSLIIYTDGGALNNPGPAGIGVVICDEKGKILEEVSGYIGETTNNIAEYQAIIEALRVAQQKYQAKKIRILLDSKLIAEQLAGNYKIKNSNLKPLHFEVKSKLMEFSSVIFRYIPREKNKEADRLVKMAQNKKSPKISIKDTVQKQLF